MSVNCGQGSGPACSTEEFQVSEREKFREMMDMGSTPPSASRRGQWEPYIGVVEHPSGVIVTWGAAIRP